MKKYNLIKQALLVYFLQSQGVQKIKKQRCKKRFNKSNGAVIYEINKKSQESKQNRTHKKHKKTDILIVY